MAVFGVDPGALAESIPRKFKLRTFILLITIVISTTIYFYLVNLYDSNTNLIVQTWRHFTQQDYNFYSGSPGGYYIEIGKQLENMTEKDRPIRITNVPSTGGYENAIKVMNDSRSFGIVQEDTVRDGDFIRNHIRYITPLYIERMHVIYRHDVFQKKLLNG